MMQRNAVRAGMAMVFAALTMTAASAQQPQRNLASSDVNAPSVVLPPGYVIGPEDVLSIQFWHDKDMSGDVTVRPDGKISIPLLNDVQAAGRTPEELQKALLDSASKFVEDPNPTVTVRDIRSRRVFITGNVAKPSAYPLNSDMDVLKLITVAGGFLEYAETEKVLIIRSQAGKPEYFRFNYKEVLKQKNVAQNIVLKPGDQVVVP